MTELILIRHGETDWNVEGRYQGQSDVPLNTSGIKQAEALAERLSNDHIEAIYSSDLARARLTAEILAQKTGAPLYLDPRLREVNQGEWEGQLFADIRERYPEELQRRRQDPLSVAPPGGETVAQVQERVLQALEAIVRRHPAGRVAIISHGVSLALIRIHLTGLPIETVWDQIPDNGQAEVISTEGS